MQWIRSAVTRLQSELALEAVVTSALLGLSLSGIRGVRRGLDGVRSMSAQRANAEDFSPSGVATFNSLASITARGDAVYLTPPPSGAHVVLFVLRMPSLSRDIALWSSVARQLPSKSGDQLVAFCDGRACATQVAADNFSTPFPVIGYTEYHTARVLLAANTAGVALALDAHLRTIRIVGWDDATPQEHLLAAIVGIR